MFLKWRSLITTYTFPAFCWVSVRRFSEALKNRCWLRLVSSLISQEVFSCGGDVPVFFNFKITPRKYPDLWASPFLKIEMIIHFVWICGNYVYPLSIALYKCSRCSYWVPWCSELFIFVAGRQLSVLHTNHIEKINFLEINNLKIIMKI